MSALKHLPRRVTACFAVRMRDFLTAAAGIIGFAALMAIGAQIDVPMHPVPMTMQSFAILLAGLCLGPVRGLLAVLAYLLAAALGLPVLADGASGLAPFNGTTAGYIYAFPLAALLAGWLSKAGQRRPVLRGVAVMTAALFALHLLLLGMGTGWLATQIPLADAISGGFTPFLFGAGVKSALCWLVWTAWRRIRRGGTG